MENFLAYVNKILEAILAFDYIWFLSGMISLLTFESFLKLVVIYFFIVWIAIVIWVTKDIINRTNNILYQIFSIFTVLLGTPLWIVVYLLIRPSKTLFEKYYEEASIEEELDLSEFEEEKIVEPVKLDIKKQTCSKCLFEIQADYKFCPNCSNPLKKDCTWCGKEIKPDWHVCPYCWKNQENKVEEILAYTEEKKEVIVEKKEPLDEKKQENA